MVCVCISDLTKFSILNYPWTPRDRKRKNILHKWLNYLEMS